MEIKKNTLLNVNHCRKGKFMGIAMKDFSIDDDWYPIALAQEDGVYGTGNHRTGPKWIIGDEIPCRKSLCEIEVLE